MCYSKPKVCLISPIGRARLARLPCPRQSPSTLSNTGMFSLLLTLVFSGFSIVVANYWLRYHIVTTGDYWLWIAFPFAVYGAIASGAAFLVSRSPAPLRLSPLALFGALIAAIFIIFDAETFLRPIFLTGTPILSEQGIIAAHIAFGKMILSVLALFIVLTALFSSTGSLALRLTRLTGEVSPADSALRFALRFVIGIGVWVGILILYHWIGLLNTGALLFTAATVLFFDRRNLIAFGRWCLENVECPSLKNPFTAFIAALLLFLVAFNITETIRPIPIGYDDMTHYMSRVVLMTERQSLPDGALYYNFELLAVGIGIATGESGQQTLALSLGAYGLLVSTLFIFLFGRALFGPRVGVTAAAIFLSMPMGPALTILETKPDSFLLPITVALVWFLVEADRSKHLLFFYFACFALGLAIGTKLTGAIFAPGLAIGFLYMVWKNKLSWLRTMRTALFSALFFALAFAPWFLHKELMGAAAYLHPKTEITLGEALTKELWGSGQKCSFLGQNEDMLRFDPEPGWGLSEIFMAPWRFTMNRYVSLFATEFGFLYLALLPLGLLLSFRTPREWLAQTAKPITLLVVTAAGAIILWGIYAEHVVWYLYPIFPILALLVALVLERAEKQRLLFWCIAALIVLGIIGNTLVRMKFGGSEPRLRYAAGDISAREYGESVFPGYLASMEILNRDPEARILVTGSRHWYGIRNSDRRAYMDTHLEAFSCLFNRYGPDGTLEALRRLGIRHVFFSKSLMSEYEGTSRPTFTKKIREFVEFSRTHLRIEWGSASHMIYRVPEQAEFTQRR